MFFVLFVFFVISVIYINGGLFLDFRLKKLWSFVICDILRMWLILSFMWAIVVFLKDGWPSGIKTDDRLINKYDSDVGNGMYRLWNGWLVFMLFSFQACQDLAFFEPPAGHIATGKTCYYSRSRSFFLSSLREEDPEEPGITCMPIEWSKNI